MEIRHRGMLMAFLFINRGMGMSRPAMPPSSWCCRDKKAPPGRPAPFAYDHLTLRADKFLGVMGFLPGFEVKKGANHGSSDEKTY